MPTDNFVLHSVDGMEFSDFQYNPNRYKPLFMIEEIFEEEESKTARLIRERKIEPLISSRYCFFCNRLVKKEMCCEEKTYEIKLYEDYLFIQDFIHKLSYTSCDSLTDLGLEWYYADLFRRKKIESFLSYLCEVAPWIKETVRSCEEIEAEAVERAKKEREKREEKIKKQKEEARVRREKRLLKTQSTANKDKEII